MEETTILYEEISSGYCRNLLQFRTDWEPQAAIYFVLSFSEVIPEFVCSQKEEREIRF